MMKNDIIAEFESSVEHFVNFKPVPELKERYRIINKLNEEFFKRTQGDNLPPYLLSRLSDWVLFEVLKDKNVDKVTDSEFAILSTGQLKRRNKRENSVEGEVMDYLNLKYIKNKDSLAKKTHKEREA